MKKINLYEALSIFFLLAGIILLWFKIDSHGVIISSIIAIGAIVFAARIFRSNTHKRRRKIAMIAVAGAIVILSIGNMLSDERHWSPIVLAMLFYTIAQRQGGPKKAF